MVTRQSRAYAGITALVLDDVETLGPKLSESVQHAFQYLGGVALPAV